MTDGSSTERSVDEINEGVREALARLDGSMLSAVSLLTGISTEKLIELGGINESGEHPAVRTVRDPAAGEQGGPGGQLLGLPER